MCGQHHPPLTTLLVCCCAVWGLGNPKFPPLSDQRSADRASERGYLRPSYASSLLHAGLAATTSPTRRRWCRCPCPCCCLACRCCASRSACHPWRRGPLRPGPPALSYPGGPPPGFELLSWAGSKRASERHRGRRGRANCSELSGGGGRGGRADRAGAARAGEGRMRVPFGGAAGSAVAGRGRAGASCCAVPSLLRAQVLSGGRRAAKLVVD